MSWNFGLLLDEHMPWALYNSLKQLHPTLPLFHINDDVAPPNATPDPAIIEWCEEHRCALVTDNRKSMPGHLRDHCNRGRHIEGIFTVDPIAFPAKELLERLALLAGATFDGEYRDQITFIKPGG